jgi:hypothetical protein
MPLPKGFESRSREDWVKISKGADASERKPLFDTLKALGVGPQDYMNWGPDKRIDFIMEAQGGGAAEEKASTKGKASSTPSSDTAGASGGSSKDIAALRKEIAELKALVLDAHFLVRVLVQSNAELNNNAQEDGIQEVLFGKLAVNRGNA